MLLFRIVVFAFANNPESESVPVEPQTLFSVLHHNRCVIDSQKELVRALPFGITLALGELKNFKEMPIRISEIKGLNAAGVFVPIRQSLRPRRGMLHLVLAQRAVSLVHVTYND